MTHEEFLANMKSRGALVSSPISSRDITLANAALQQRRCAMIPTFLMELYQLTGSLNLDTGYIFGPLEVSQNRPAPIPSITKINEEIVPMGKTIGKTIFGRNDLFWFAFDAFGNFYMLDNLNLNTLRKYDDPYKALADCLIAGKV